MTLALANTTTLIVGPGTLHPFTRHFAVAVNGMRTLEEFAPRRTVLGLGTGGSYVGEVGIKAARMAQMRTVVELSRKLMRGERVTTDAPAMPLVDARLRFPDARLVPMYIAATGNKMLALAGEIADGILAHVGANPRTIQYARERIQEGAGNRTADLGPADISLYIYSSVSSDASVALAECRRGVAALLGRDTVYGDLAGVSEAELEAIRSARTRSDAVNQISEDTVSRLAISGTVEQCVERIATLADAGVHHITCVLTGPRISESLDAYGRDIIPQFRA
jgi:5,10-methylenetetrahydromethanopterin reductase